jgi:hypothetical protein
MKLPGRWPWLRLSPDRLAVGRGIHAVEKWTSGNKVRSQSAAATAPFAASPIVPPDMLLMASQTTHHPFTLVICWCRSYRCAESDTMPGRRDRRERNDGNARRHRRQAEGARS